jgi:septal ring factor EnvC (AmiA/AmiB activator)
MPVVAMTTKQLETELNEVSRKLAEVSGDVERLQRELAEVKAASAKQQACRHRYCWTNPTRRRRSRTPMRSTTI